VRRCAARAAVRPTNLTGKGAPMGLATRGFGRRTGSAVISVMRVGWSSKSRSANIRVAVQMHWHVWVVLIAGSTGSALRAVRPPNLHTTPDVGAISSTPRVRRAPCSAHPWPSWPKPSLQFNSTHIYGTSVPVKELSTASRADTDQTLRSGVPGDCRWPSGSAGAPNRPGVTAAARIGLAAALSFGPSDYRV
jgi:hypothetical protein